MEPKILVIGKTQSVLDDLASKLKEYNRDVLVSTNSEENLQYLIETNSIDFVVIGSGLPEEKRVATVDFILSIDATLSIHLIDRKKSKGLKGIISFINGHVGKFKEQGSVEK